MNLTDIATKDDLKDLEQKLDQLLRNSEPLTLKSPWIKIKTAVKMYGLSQNTIYNLRASGKVGHSRIGGTVFINKNDLEAILEQNYQPPVRGAV